MARRERKEQRRKREELVAKYFEICSNMVARGEDYLTWLQTGTPYERGCKLVAERDVLRLRKEVKHLGT